MIKHYFIKAFFRNPYNYLLLLPVVVSLYGCPFSSPYKLDSEPSLYADESLVGKWATLIETRNGNQQPIKLIIGKINDNEYAIDFTGNLRDLTAYTAIKDDTIKGKAFLSTVADRQFLNIEINGQTYISQVIYNNNTLSLLPLAERFTTKYIKSGNELRTAVEIHFRNRSKPLYDESFCLWKMVRVN